jgi:hypothetical protein
VKAGVGADQCSINYLIAEGRLHTRKIGVNSLTDTSRFISDAGGVDHPTANGRNVGKANVARLVTCDSKYGCGEVVTDNDHIRAPPG